MEIDINQKKISIGDKYQIFTEGNQTHRAAAKVFRVFAEINLYDLNSDFPLMTVKRKFAWLAAKFDLSKKDGNAYQLITKSFWKGHYQCVWASDVYDLYAHRGRKLSVYKNNRQIAWWDQKVVTWFAGDNYKIIADNDCDKLLLLCFCLAIDNYSSNDGNKKTVNFNIGRIGPQVRKFDPDWKPK